MKKEDTKPEIVDADTTGPNPKDNPEAPRERQGDGVATGEVPAGYYDKN